MTFIAVYQLEKMLRESSEDLFFDNILNSIKDLGYQINCKITTSTMTTMNIVTLKNTRK